MKKNRNYGEITPEIRAEAVKSARKGTLTQQEVAEAFGVTPRALRRWIRETEEVELAKPLSEEERAELVQLRKESARLREENDILKKFAAFVESLEK